MEVLDRREPYKQVLCETSCVDCFLFFCEFATDERGDACSLGVPRGHMCGDSRLNFASSLPRPPPVAWDEMR